MTERRSKKANRHHHRGNNERRSLRSKTRDRGPLKYFAFWKPYDVLSQFKPASGSSADTLASYIEHSDIYPVGRLDRDSEGLLLLSNDGLFQHKLCDPRFKHWRTYLVQIERTPSLSDLTKLCEGIKIKGSLTSPARAELLDEAPLLPNRTPPIRKRKTVETSWIKLSLTEGRNRQVRRMTAAIGFPTLRLIRSEIELTKGVTISLLGLSPGELRPLSLRESQAVEHVKKRRPSYTESKK